MPRGTSDPPQRPQLPAGLVLLPTVRDAIDAATEALGLERGAAVHGEPGKHPGEAILSWPRDPRAVGYALGVKLAPHCPGSPWTAMLPGTTRTRLVRAPAPASLILARVASIGEDGGLGAWSASVLIRTR